MIINFRPQEFREHLLRLGVPRHTVRSVVGMLKNLWNIPLPQRYKMLRKWEEKGWVVIDWDHKCPCGICDPDILLELPRGREK